MPATKKQKTSIVEYTATVETTRVYKEDTGFTVVDVRTGRGGIKTVICTLPFRLTIGQEIGMQGEDTVSLLYGEQFKASNLWVIDPTTATGINAYLASGVISGIGPAMAARIVAMFGDKTLDILDQDPSALLNVSGIGDKTLQKIAASWKDEREAHHMVMELCKIGLSPTLSAKVYKKYEGHAVQMVRANPYRLADDISGIGFMRADDIARCLGFDMKHPFRLKSGMLFALKEAQSHGHCFLPLAEFVLQSSRLLGVDEDVLDEPLQALIMERRITPKIFEHYYEEGTQTLVYYLTNIFLAERYIEDRLLSLAHAEHKDIQIQLDSLLTPGQKDAAIMALQNGVSIITGSAGTGKTTVLRAIISCLELNNLSYVLCAPTGKASKRISEVTERPASTIHRLIGYKRQLQSETNEAHLLDCDAIICDEFSMVDTLIFAELLRAAPAGCRILLIGDKFQLKPVGVGANLSDLIESAKFPVTTLTEIHRQKKGSNIIRIANDIKDGIFPSIPNTDDAYMFEIQDADKIADCIVDLTTKKIPAKFGVSFDDIQILSPMRKGVIGIEALNRVIQDAVQDKDAPSLKGFKAGDRVMQLINNYSAGESGVFNGEHGLVDEINMEDRIVYVLFEGIEERIPYEFTDLDQIGLSFVVSIHKSQGSEFRICVILLHHGISPMLLSRDLVYTGVTRARDVLVIVGTKKALHMAIKNSKERKRYTGLFKQ